MAGTGKRGRRAVDKGLRVAAGTYYPSKHGALPPVEHTERPTPTAALAGDAAAEWKRLAAAAHLGPQHSGQLTTACQTFALLQSAIKAAGQMPLDSEARTAVAAYSTAYATALKALGLTPNEEAKHRVMSRTAAAPKIAVRDRTA